MAPNISIWFNPNLRIFLDVRISYIRVHDKMTPGNIENKISKALSGGDLTRYGQRRHCHPFDQDLSSANKRIIIHDADGVGCGWWTVDDDRQWVVGRLKMWTRSLQKHLSLQPIPFCVLFKHLLELEPMDFKTRLEK